MSARLTRYYMDRCRMTSPKDHDCPSPTCIVETEGTWRTSRFGSLSVHLQFEESQVSGHPVRAMRAKPGPMTLEDIVDPKTRLPHPRVETIRSDRTFQQLLARTPSSRSMR
jgi:hypothetical protein